jgi:alkylated DNA repair protein alkB family protein 1
MTTDTSDKGISAFKRAQVRYRRQGAAPNRSDDLDDMLDFLDFSNPDADHRMFRVECPSIQDIYYQGPIYGVTNFPGFLYAPQSVSPSLQNELAYLAVSEYCEAPHATNIDLLPPKTGVEDNNSTQSMWDLWKQQNGYTVSTNDIIKRGAGRTMKKYRSFAKLSWSTMGYHYDWSARAYHEGRTSPVPPVLERLAAMFARTALATSHANSNKFTASACIVNYYNTKSIMGGHRDDLELALDKPVISFSMGLPAVFLLGGNKKDDVPVLPILVRPGDVMMLGGDCRLCYHGMARVLSAAVSLPAISKELRALESFQITRESIMYRRSNGPTNEHSPNVRDETIVPDSDREALTEYLKTHRINMNVRQVLPDGMDVLPAMPGVAQNS